MRRILLPLLFIVLFHFFSAFPAYSAKHDFVLPRDGTFYIEAKPTFRFKAILTESWANPDVNEGSLCVFAPVLPELPGQKRVSTRFLNLDRDKLKSELIEESFGRRPMLMLCFDPNELSLKRGLRLKLKYEGILYARTLKKGKPPKAFSELTEDERHCYLSKSNTMDFNEPAFVLWMNEQKLKLQEDEDTMQFAYRVFSYLVENGKYEGNISGYEARRPSNVCKSLSSDCGGLALLFVAVMRANGIPARTLFGRWAITQTDDYGQYHVTAEFFVNNSGWVPVDISGTIIHKPELPFFGRTDGKHIAFHVDTDLEPVNGFQHAWAQYMLLQWSGKDDFWKKCRHETKWEVQRWPLKTK